MNSPLFKKPNLLSATLPAVYLAIVLIFDWIEPFRSVTPPLCTMGLLFMATLLIPQWMCWWALVYSTVVVMVLLDPRLFSFLSNGYSPPELISHKFRAAGFLSTALFCCIFSYLLTRLRRKREFLNHLIARMPFPVVLSDAQGESFCSMMMHGVCLVYPPRRRTSFRVFRSSGPKIPSGEVYCRLPQGLSGRNGCGRSDRTRNLRKARYGNHRVIGYPSQAVDHHAATAIRVGWSMALSGGSCPAYLE